MKLKKGMIITSLTDLNRDRLIVKIIKVRRDKRDKRGDWLNKNQKIADVEIIKDYDYQLFKQLNRNGKIIRKAKINVEGIKIVPKLKLLFLI